MTECMSEATKTFFKKWMDYIPPDQLVEFLVDVQKLTKTEFNAGFAGADQTRNMP